MLLRWGIIGAMIGSIVTTRAAAQESGHSWLLDSLRQTAGPAWHQVKSPHFIVYSEYDGKRAQNLIDNLESAWLHARTLLGSAGAATAPIRVFITASRTRFSRVMKPTNKGMQGRSIDGRDLIVIVHNDSVRAYTRHEVMHAMVTRAWGPGSMNHGAWLGEGIATFADGLCLNVPISVVARDELRRQPSLTIAHVVANFHEMQDKSRGRAYALAGSLVEFLWNTRGREAVKRLWIGTDSIAALSTARSGFGLPPETRDVNREWREYLERVAGNKVGPELAELAELQRHGCG